jgi:hypothetical protein
MYYKILPLLVAVILIAGCKKESAVSKSPQVTPVQGTIKADWGDTITIAGQNLPAETSVLFGTVSGKVISNNGQQLRCVVPFFNDAPTISVFINFNGQSTVLTNYLTLNAPVISSFTPTQSIGDTIIINGDHFSSTAQVNFGGVAARITSTSKKQLGVVVPGNIRSVNTAISVTSQLQTTTAATNFVVLKPVITSITPSAFIGDQLTITGKYFDLSGPYLLTLDGVPVPDAVVDKSHITFNLPYKTYPNRKTTITLKLLEYAITYPIDVTVKNNWVMVKQGIPFTAYNAIPITIGPDVYVVAPQKNTAGQTFYLWHFNQTDFSWSTVGSQITFINGNYRTGTNGTKIYLYNSAGANTFYEGDPATGIWTAKANFIGPQRNNPAMFGIGGNLYMGSGQRFVNNQSQSIDDWYVYKPGTNTWQQIADMRTGFQLNYPMSGAQAAVINNIAYVVCGGWFYDYKYNVATNIWTPMQNMLEPRVQAGVVTYNQKIYTLKGYVVQNVGNSNRDVFSYDPVTDNWAYEPFDVDPFDDELSIGFVAGGKMYMLSYDSFDVNNNLYEALTLP